VVLGPAFPPQQAIGHPPAQTDVLTCDLSEAMPELVLLDQEDFYGVSLSAAVLRC